jgi:HEAT repeat protein
LFPLLEDPDTQVRWAAAWALGQQAHRERQRHPRVLPALLAIVRDRSTRVREDAWIRVADGAFEIGLDAHTARNAGGEKFRIAAIQAIGAFGEAAASLVPDLIDALEDDDPYIRWFAARAIGAVGPRARAAVPALIGLLQSSTRLTRFGDNTPADVRPQSPATLQVMAAKALGKIGPEARTAVPALLRAMDDRDLMLRLVAAEALGGIGPEDPGIIPALARAMTDKVDVNLAQQAARALWVLGEAGIPALVHALHDRDADVRVRAAGILTQSGMAANVALPELERAVAIDDDPDARQAIADAIREIRKHDPEAGFKGDPDEGRQAP